MKVGCFDKIMGIIRMKMSSRRKLNLLVELKSGGNNEFNVSIEIISIMDSVIGDIGRNCVKFYCYYSWLIYYYLNCYLGMYYFQDD